MHLTTKQIDLMRVIVAGNGAQDPSCDLDQILDRIQYVTSKQSLQFSLRALLARGLIVKLGLQRRRGRMRQVIASTDLGRSIMAAPAPKPAFIESDDGLDDDLGSAETVEP